MLEHIVTLLSEIATEIGYEYVHEPMRMLAEIVQFLVLLGIVWVVAIGFGKRRGFVANMLTERQTGVAARVERASHASEALAEAKSEATGVTRKGRAEARTLVTDAKKECAALEESARAETDADCARIEERAQSALATEHQEMLLELREQLVELVSSATRSIMNEQLTAAEQRALIEQTIVGSIDASGTGAARGHHVVARPATREA